MTLLKSSKLPVESSGGLAVSGGGIFKSVVNTEVVELSFRANARLPFSNRRLPRHALEPARVVRSQALVLAVLPWCSLTQVFPSIVVRLYVLVVNLMLRPFSGLNEPYQPSSGVNVLVDGYVSVTAGLDRSSKSATHFDVDRMIEFWPIFPKQLSSLWKVQQDRPNILGRKVVAVIMLLWESLRSHATLLWSWWSGAESVLTTPNGPDLLAVSV